MKRITKPTGSTYTLADAEALTIRTVAAQIQRETLVAQRDAAILAAAQPYAPDIDQLDAEIRASLTLLETWADANTDRFGTAESITLGGHRIGWRIGNPTVSPAPKRTWAKILDTILASPAHIRDRYLRTKVEPNKEAILADRDTHPDTLRDIGVRIVQQRRFYLDPAREGQADTLLTQD